MTQTASRTGLIAKKVGMTRVYTETGKNVPVTVLHVDALQVVAHRTKEKNGYTAVQLGAFAQKAQRLSKPQAGHFRKAGVEAKKVLAEFRIEGGELPAVGTELKADHFQPGQMVDISGLSKGRGMQGAMYRWNFGGGRASHGNSLSHRVLGGTGSRQDPGKVFKGKKMAGHMGVENITIQNLEVVKVDAENGLLLVKGSVPGNTGSVLYVRDALKAAAKAAKAAARKASK